MKHVQRIERTGLWDFAVLSAAAVLIGAYCYFVTRHRILWSDELFGWMLVSDPSWTHMLRAWNLGADGGGIGFYVLCRLWLKIFGQHILAFRFFSATGIFVGFAATWLSLRRFYSLPIVALALVTVWFDSRVLLWHILQTRFYGMLVGAVACAVYVSVRSAAEADAQKSAVFGTLCLTFLINLALVSTHPFGFAYCALVLLAAFANDRLRHRRRPAYYAAALLPWVVLIFSRTALRNSARVGKPWFWTTTPTQADLWITYRPDYLPILFPIAVTLFCIVIVSMLWRSHRQTIVQGLGRRSELLIPGLLLLLTPMVFWAVSQRGTSYFVDRYFCPFTIGVAVLGAELLTHIFRKPLSFQDPLPLLFAAAISIWLGCNVYPVMFEYAQELQYPSKDFTGELASMLPRNEPVVLQRADIFDLMIFYRDAPDLPMYTCLDWPLALSPQSPRWLVSAMHEMENWKLAGYYSDHIVDSVSFLKSHSRFVVVEDGITPWFHQRIATQPGWHIRKLGHFERGMWTSDIWEVTR